ncbi:hypothetical protein BDM02DRAFT_3132818 [Thelephora ganbajun]|uniref:Uncharacterized protein n=1 Tax=Thelephora ganbajun TaxID=370292 RepID=A0ACB6YZG2_THEGA|nr:hypothetical protein BDM02DRAFT_3132818 [Thelephora ganbajun]
MRQVIAFLEWKSTSWGGKVGSRLGSVTADIQHGIDSYARKQWLPCLLTLELDITWAGTYPWAAEITAPVAGHSRGSSSVHKNSSPGDPFSTKAAPPSEKRDNVIKPADFSDDSGDKSDEICLEADGEGGIGDEGENSDGFGMGFEYDDEYMS